VANDLEQLEKLWSAGVSTLIELAAKRSQATAIARRIGLERVGVGTIPIRPGQIDGLEVVREHQHLRGSIAVVEVLAALAELGQPVEPPMVFGEPVRGAPARIKDSADHFYDRGVNREIEERQRYEEHLEGEKAAAR
jgi:hypothetical protein